MSDPSQILVIRLSSIGDVLLATPLVRVLRREYPRARLRFLVKPEYAELLRFNPHLDEVVAWPAARGRREERRAGTPAGEEPPRIGAPVAESAPAWAGAPRPAAIFSPEVKQLARDLRSGGALWVVDLQASPRSRAFTVLLRAARRFTYRKDYARRQLLLKAKINAYADPPESVAERYFGAAAQLGLQPDGGGLEIVPGEEAERKAAETLPGGGWLAVAPGARWATKRWPPESFASAARAIAARRGLRVAILGGADDSEPARVIAELLSAAGIAALDLTGSLSLLESAAVLARCEALLVNDSGLLHLAAALCVPAVAVFGSTVPQFGFAPYRSPARVLGIEGLPCRPCTHFGRPACPLGHFACMRRIPPSQVARAAFDLLPKGGARTAGESPDA